MSKEHESSIQQRMMKLCNDSEGVTFHNDYGGRGMYGEQCVGISGRRADLMDIISETIMQEVDDLIFNSKGEEDWTPNLRNLGSSVKTLLGYSQDSLGCDVIFYWPSLKPIAEVV